PPKRTSIHALYTLSLHDALPIYEVSHRMSALPPENRVNLLNVTPSKVETRLRGFFERAALPVYRAKQVLRRLWLNPAADFEAMRSEEHTSELQSRGHLVCRLLLE